MPRRSAPRPRAIGYALLCVALVAFAVSAARCYPKDTRVVVFVQGLYTTYDASGTQGTLVEPHRFDTLKDALRDHGYRDEDLLDFSYDGGVVTASGAWRPRDYACEATDRPGIEHVLVLEQMLRDYRREHPQAHFTLVGHSLGGYVAFLAGARDAVRPKETRLEIDGVVTLDSPLLGASADKKAVLDLVPCEKTFEAGGELVLQRADPATPAIRAYQAAAMHEGGVRLATLGNVNDCLWATSRCIGGDWIDDGATQFIPSADVVGTYEIASDLLASHDAILVDPEAVAQTVAFIGTR
jgi:pimeloyl-ACP methyl ester carboxylesterase